jgi:hypothetical protein
MVFKLSHVLKAVVCAVLAVQLAGCGTIMYPGRRGQQGGKIDAGVAVLDGVGLLLFIIPGVIAFAVDFSDGAIYLPGTSRSSLDLKNIKIVKFDTGHGSAQNLENIIKEETGYNVKFSQADLKVIRLNSKDDVRANLAAALSADNK